MPDPTSAQTKGDVDTGHANAHADPFDDPAAQEGRRRGILFLVILTVATILVFTGFMLRVFSAI
jgi:hypothetical protein